MDRVTSDEVRESYTAAGEARESAKRVHSERRTTAVLRQVFRYDYEKEFLRLEVQQKSESSVTKISSRRGRTLQYELYSILSWGASGCTTLHSDPESRELVHAER